IEHDLSSVMKAIKACTKPRLILEVTIFQHIHDLMSPFLADVLVVTIKTLLVEDIASEKVERNEVGDQPVRQPGIRMRRICTHQQKALIRPDILQFDLAELS